VKRDVTGLVWCNERILSPAGKRLWGVALPTKSLSGWEDMLDGLARHKFSFRLGNNFGQLRYAQVCIPAGKTSCRVTLLINSLSGRERTWERCGINQSCLRLGIYLAVWP